MSGFGVHISVNNLPQFDRLQSNAIRVPAVHQSKNAEIARAHMEQQVKTASEPEGAEGKNIDPEDRKKEQNCSKKRSKKKKKKDKSTEDQNRNNGNGSLIDIEA
ncbi:MAG: hypothetical protein ACLFVE_05260 [Chitinispirillaceae bacterium]